MFIFTEEKEVKTTNRYDSAKSEAVVLIFDLIVIASCKRVGVRGSFATYASW